MGDVNPATTLVLATFAVQAAEGLLLGVVLLAFHRLYRRRYLLDWSLSWFALCLYHLLGAAALAAASLKLDPNLPLRVVLSASGLTAGYLQAGWLLLGTHDLATGRAVSPRLRTTLLVTVAVVGIGLSLPFTWTPAAGAERFLLRFGVRGGAAGIVYLIAAVWVWRTRARSGSLGIPLVAGGFTLVGLQQLHYLAISAWQVSTSRFNTYGAYLGLLDFFFYLVIGLGLVVWLLEEERERVMAAGERFDYLANHDPLTGLPNRELLLRRTELAIARARPAGLGFAVVSFDVDRFRTLNTSLGHASGDELLRTLAGRLTHRLWDGCTIARTGEDQFALLFTDVGAEPVLRLRLEELLSLVRQPFLVHGQELFVTISCGAALFPVHGPSGEKLLQRAEAAMMSLQQEGRDSYRLFSAGLAGHGPERVGFETDLHRAIDRGELILHFQPIVRIETGTVEAVEALVRWPHHDRGLLLPGEFLGVAEASGTIDALEELVLGAACAQAQAWREAGLRGLSVAVNLTPRQFQDPHLPARVERALGLSGLPPRHLQLELTESAALHGLEVVLAILRDLKEIGVSVAIDDFGTGYSSLDLLRVLPVDLIKIDRSFIRGLGSSPRDEAIAAAVVTLAHGLGLEVTAEGVETEPQHAALRRLGCDLLQGYLVSRPLPAEECAVILRQLKPQRVSQTAT